MKDLGKGIGIGLFAVSVGLACIFASPHCAWAFIVVAMAASDIWNKG